MYVFAEVTQTIRMKMVYEVERYSEALVIKEQLEETGSTFYGREVCQDTEYLNTTVSTFEDGLTLQTALNKVNPTGFNVENIDTANGPIPLVTMKL